MLTRTTTISEHISTRSYYYIDTVRTYNTYSGCGYITTTIIRIYIYYIYMRIYKAKGI